MKTKCTVSRSCPSHGNELGLIQDMFTSYLLSSYSCLLIFSSFWMTIVQVAKTWKFAEAPKSIARIENAEMLPNAKLKDLGRLLDADGYVVGAT